MEEVDYRCLYSDMSERSFLIAKEIIPCLRTVANHQVLGELPSSMQFSSDKILQPTNILYEHSIADRAGVMCRSDELSAWSKRFEVSQTEVSEQK